MGKRMLAAGLLSMSALLGVACAPAQSAADAAGGLLSDAAGLTGAAADLAGACAAAAAAWVPGVSGADARAAIDEGLALARRGLADNPELPGADGVLTALEEAQRSLADPGSSIAGVSDRLLTSACGIFLLG